MMKKILKNVMNKMTSTIYDLNKKQKQFNKPFIPNDEENTEECDE